MKPSSRKLNPDLNRSEKKGDIHLLSEQNLFTGFISIDELRFYIAEKQASIRRFVVRRPEAAAILLYNKDHQSVVLIRQFRAPLYRKEPTAFIYEVPAGVLNPGENPEETIIRECLEETGYRIGKPQLLSSIYPSPGIFDERIHLFFAEVSDKDKINAGGGLVEEHEYLEVVEIPVRKAFDMVHSGEIADAKTISCLFFAKSLLQTD